jgi:hypothetical protein
VELAQPTAPEQAALGARAGGLGYALSLARTPAPTQMRLLSRLQRTVGNRGAQAVIAAARLPGVIQRSSAGAADAPSVSAKELWERFVVAQRAWDISIPQHALEDAKQKLAQMEAQLAKEPSNRQLRRSYNALKNRIQNFSAQSQHLDPGVKGEKMQGGYNTYAVIMVKTADGDEFVGLGKFSDGRHAEQAAIKELQGTMGDKSFAGAKVIVVVDQDVCPEVCRPALQEFAAKYNVESVQACVLQRPKAVGAGAASGKTTATTALQSGTREATEHWTTIYTRAKAGGGGGSTSGPASGSGALSGSEKPSLSSKGPPGAGPGHNAESKPATSKPFTGPQPDMPPSEEASSPAPRRPRGAGSFTGSEVDTGLTGTLAPVAAGLAIHVAGSLLTMWMQKSIMESVSKMPPPTINAAKMWLPKGMEGRTALDLVASQLPALADNIEESRVQMTGRMLEFWATFDTLPPEQRVPALNAAADAIEANLHELLEAQRNVGAARAMAPEIAEKAQAAEELRAFVESKLGMYVLLYEAGMGPDQLSQISSNLAYFHAALTRRVLEPLERLDVSLDRCIESNAALLKQLDAKRAGAAPQRIPVAPDR